MKKLTNSQSCYTASGMFLASGIVQTLNVYFGTEPKDIALAVVWFLAFGVTCLLNIKFEKEEESTTS